MANQYFLFILFLLLTFNRVQSQFASVKYVSPTSCSSSQYFDISQLSCLSCPSNSKVDSTGLIKFKYFLYICFTFSN